MSKFTSAKRINTRWRGNDFVGAPGSSHTFPNELHDEFLVDWAYPIQIGDITITETPTTGNIQVASLTVGDIVLTGNATGDFGTSGGTVVQGTAPISISTTSNTSTVSLNASYSTSTHLHASDYQPLGTYVTSVSGTAPITTSGTTAITVGINQTAITANSATNAEVIRTYVKNTSGSTMTKGQAVYVSGADGTNVTIQLSTASTEAGSSKTLGLLAQDLANNAFGYVIENGLLVGIDTSAATAGQTVWLGNTPGSRVYGAPPAEPSHSVYLGVVARSNVNNGEILVKVQNGYELDELHDVSAASPTNGDVLQYNSTSGLWEKESLSTAGIAASVHTHATSSITSGNFVATLAAGTGVTVTGADANAAAKTVAIGQAVATSSNVTFSQIIANDYLQLPNWNHGQGGLVGTATSTPLGAAGTYSAIGGTTAPAELSFTPDFIGQKFMFSVSGYASLNTTTIQYAFVRLTLTDSANASIEDLGYLRSENFGTTSRGSSVALTHLWVADTTSPRKIKLYATAQTTASLTLTFSYWRLSYMALA
jgi:hypothetical protein